MESVNIATQAIEVMANTKALDIKKMDVRELTDITDTMVICTATSDRHAKTIADKIITSLKDQGIVAYGISGKNQGHWILIDYTDVVIHIMLTEERDFYDLEKLWTLTQSSREQTL